ncbi:beta-ketoacyl-[acyl-carrier-protein] synthase family protein [bacterium]|nr:beta-ketoacyl-[acyl-carrier-protein] synthase family protein [bacterium]MBU1753920.1 beta-ketoacyl-[acyl-carrier-protein] synthase family protein [bacterium]
MERAVITGIGLITCVGKGKEIFWKSIMEGKSSISEVTLFDTSKYRNRLGGEIKGIDPEIQDRAWYLLSSAAKEAVSDAGIELKEVKEGRVQIIVGTAHGELIMWGNYYDALRENDEVKAEELCHYFSPWTLSKRLSQDFGIKSLTITTSTACTASTIALGLALNKIRRREADVVIVGGVDVLSEFIFAGFDSLRALTLSVCKPFDKKRDGLILGEGSGVLIIEGISHALKRNAKVYAELAGFGTYSDAVHLTAPDRRGRGATLSLSAALKDAQVKPEDISYINAHGTGTIYNDRMECVAIKKIFEEYAYKIPISSIKPVIGHTSGASGVIEAALCALCIQDNVVPPTINFEEPMLDFEFDFVPGKYRETLVTITASMNSAFGGSNACVVLKEL